jgi:hypothetical protein
MKCVRCGTLVQAQEEEVAWLCAQCGQGLLLTPEGLAPLTVHWAAVRGEPGAYRWLPFWALPGTVRFGRREAFNSRREPDPIWREPKRFYVPAYPLSLEDMQRWGAHLTRWQAQMQTGPAAGPVANCTLFPDDARQAAEFIVLTIEAEQKDKLREVTFSLELGEPELWMLPFNEKGELQPAPLS